MGPTPGRGVSGNVRRLYLVGFSDEHGGLLLAGRKGAKSGSFVLAVDDELWAEVGRARRGVASERDRAAHRRSGVESALSPREIQARLRAGRSLEEVAAEAGVGVEWVDRFAAPVLAEQAAAVGRAWRAVLQTTRRGPSDRPLEASVLRNLADRGASMTTQEFQDGWTARHLVDTDWLVAFTFRNRGRSTTAEWTLNLANGALTPRNRAGTELGFVEAAPRAVSPAGVGDTPKVPSPAAPARRRAVSVPAKGARPAGTAAAERPAVQKAPVAATDVPRKVAAAPRPAALRRVAVPVAHPAAVPRPRGAHYTRSAEPPAGAAEQEASNGGPAEGSGDDRPPEGTATRPRRTRARSIPAEQPRLPLGPSNDGPDDGGIRFGNPG